MCAPHIFEAVDNWNLTDDRTHPGIGRRQHQGVAARIGDAPDANPLRVHRRVPFDERDRVLVIADLRPRVEMLTVVAIADAEVAIIENHCVDAGRCEGRSVGWHDDLAHITPATRQHDRRPTPGSIRLIEPRATYDALRFELDVKTLNHADCPPAVLSIDYTYQIR